MRHLTVLLCLAVATCVYGQTQPNTTDHRMRPEEALVRTTYAKLSFADETRIILETLQHTGREKLWTTRSNLADVALNSRLTFELSDFHFGKLKDIADRKVVEFDGSLTAIGGEVLDVTPSIFNYVVDKSPAEYVAYVKFAWKPSPYHSLSDVENWPVAKVLQADQFEGKKYTDYVTYTVTVTLGNKSRTYETWMLLGQDEKGKQQIYFMDAVADPTALLFAYEHSMYPAAFVKSDLRTVPFVDKWLYDNALVCRAGESEKDNKRTDVCCDPASGRCGVARSSLLPRSSRRMAPGQKAARVLPASFHIIALPLHPVMQSTPSCTQFNVNTTFPHALADTQEHNSGDHSFGAPVLGSCAYTDGSSTPGPCNVQCTATASSVAQESGSLSGLAFVHATSKSDASGGSFSNGGTSAIQCQGTSAMTVRSCTVPCSTSVSISASASGVGATISFPPSALWNDQNQGMMTCQPRSTAPTPTPTPTPTPNPGGGFCGPSGCGCFWPCTTPIVIDVDGQGFSLTNAAHGVNFDMGANGHPIQVAWTSPGVRNGFLALPGPDGLIHNGSQLFGNVTPQPASSDPNGFRALAVFDDPKNGGNGDGVIDENDAVWTSLRVWIDLNHDGISQPNELFTLSSLGIDAINLDYKLDRRTDPNGNVFRYRGTLKSQNANHKVFDVILVNELTSPQASVSRKPGNASTAGGARCDYGELPPIQTRRLETDLEETRR